MRHQLLSMAAGLTLVLTAGAATVHASPCQSDNNSKCDNGGPQMNATPELDSIALFGTGAAGMASYALLRLRAGRRKDSSVADGPVTD